MAKKNVKWYVMNEKGEYPTAALGKGPSFDVGIMVQASNGNPVDLDPKKTYEYNVDPKRRGNVQPMYITQNLFIMHESIVHALKKCGVKNLQLFKAVIRDSNEVHSNYWLVNVLQAVNAIDRKSSITFEQKMGEKEDLFFGPLGYETLSIDEKNAEKSGLLVFRLKGSGGTLIVHSSVRDRFLKEKIEGVEFIQPEDWAGA